MNESNDSIALLRPRKRKPRHKVADLTLAEVAVLEALDEAIRLHGNPSLREVAECSDITRSASVIHKYMHRLELKGYVGLTAGRARSIRLLRPIPKGKV